MYSGKYCSAVGSIYFKFLNLFFKVINTDNESFMIGNLIFHKIFIINKHPFRIN